LTVCYNDPMTALLHRPLGSSGIEVSALALGSWQTYERVPRETAAAVLARARELGIDFLEVARYNDQTGTAPIATGYSEVVFGEAFRLSGWPREQVVIAEKLWWEFWPQQDAAAELDASLERTGLDRVDFVYSDPPPDDLPIDEVVGAVGDLVRSGRARAWGIVNWPADRLLDAGRAAERLGLPGPCAAQLPYSLVSRSWVEGPEMVEALRFCGAGVVASWTLAGGILTGKYAAHGSKEDDRFSTAPSAFGTSPGGGGIAGRMAGQLDQPRARPAVDAVEPLRALAAETGTTPAALAIAFALSRPNVTTVLFGATSPEQVEQNVRAVELLPALDGERLSRLERIGATDR
jgi:aryl-alcohol dehydrogenase-like predicted oxidoreductase